MTLLRSTARRVTLVAATLGLAPFLAASPASSATAATAGPATAAQAAPNTGTQSDWPVDPAHPFSNPVYMPLRHAAKQSCTYNNCPQDGIYHGYWAIDWLTQEHDLDPIAHQPVQRNDPIYAAGAGIAHIGANDGSCGPAGQMADGRWVWIDHGNGVVSRYHHLSEIDISDGQLVTPATRIGVTGHSGDMLPCVTSYLHFEVRHGGVTGTRVDPGMLTACLDGTAAHLPDVPQMGNVTNWNDVVVHQRVNPTFTPDSDNSCLPSSTQTPAQPAAVTAHRSSGTVQLSWPKPPAGVTAVVVTREMYAPSLGRWDAHVPVRLTLPVSSTGTRVTGLQNGRPYRFSLTYENATGPSAASAPVAAVPAGAPNQPHEVRWLAATRTGLRFGWRRPTANGTPVTSHTVQLRRWTGRRWTNWVSYAIPSDLSWKWSYGTPHTRYQVRVRANSAAGPSAWSPTYTVTTRR